MDILTYRKHRPRGPMLWKQALFYDFGTIWQNSLGFHRFVWHFKPIVLCKNLVLLWLYIIFTDIFFSKHRPSGPMLSISQNVHMCVCLSVCLFTLEVPFNGLYAPTSWSRMSNIFRDSESLAKNNWKKWSHLWTFLFESGLKLPRKKKFVFLLILPYKTWWKPRVPMD